jgi:hypothetical protein
MGISDDELKYSDKEDTDEESSDGIPEEIPKEQRVLRTQAYDKSIADIMGQQESLPSH